MSESEPVRGFEKGGVIARLQAESDAFDLQRAKEEGFATLKEWNDYHSSRTEYLWEVLEKEGDSGEFFCDDPEANPKAGYNPKKCSCQDHIGRFCPGNLRSAPGSMTGVLGELDEERLPRLKEMVINEGDPSKRLSHDNVHHLWSQDSEDDEQLYNPLPWWADRDNVSRHAMSKPPIKTLQEKLQGQPNPLKRLRDTLAVEREDDEGLISSRPGKRARHTAIHHTLPPQKVSKFHDRPAPYPSPLKRVRTSLADEDEDEDEGPNAKRIRRMVAHNNATLQRRKDGRAGTRLRSSPMKGSSGGGGSQAATPGRHKSRSPQPSAKKPQQTVIRSSLEPEIGTTAGSPVSYTSGVNSVPGDVEAQIEALKAEQARAHPQQGLEALQHEEARGFPIQQEPQHHRKNVPGAASLKRGRGSQTDEEAHDEAGTSVSPAKKLRRTDISARSTAVPTDRNDTAMTSSAIQQPDVEDPASVGDSAPALVAEEAAAGPAAAGRNKTVLEPRIKETKRGRGAMKGRVKKNPPAGGKGVPSKTKARTKAKATAVISPWLKSLLENPRQTRSQKQKVFVELDAQSQVVPVRGRAGQFKAVMIPATRSSRAK